MFADFPHCAVEERSDALLEARQSAAPKAAKSVYEVVVDLNTPFGVRAVLDLITLTTNSVLSHLRIRSARDPRNPSTSHVRLLDELNEGRTPRRSFANHL